VYFPSKKKEEICAKLKFSEVKKLGHYNQFYGLLSIVQQKLPNAEGNEA
jgi:hypothetical protein